MMFPPIELTFCYQWADKPNAGSLCRGKQCSKFAKCLKDRVLAIQELKRLTKYDDYNKLMVQQGYKE